MYFAMRLLVLGLALLTGVAPVQAASTTTKNTTDMKPFSHWMPTGGKCVMTGVGTWLCKSLPKQDIKRVRNGTCISTGPDFLSCGPGAVPLNSTSCVPSGPFVFRCGREDLLVDKYFCLEAWEGVHMCKEEKPLAVMPKVPGALGG
ncbi:uncharacterized protein K489DRAFT_385256 [Dissoconium aciculare CBS 342.82]|uniref:Uncharacterized protein n=1 Tax=Dissoconium aciculare CBS 342.82 TaxID=1314786 RepID=A0A6J3LR91_9PEZI|nr:uncharacterized protein K489DRAFT_385256 [Dissoconium aciculare CBS 342.82]KAF1818138.1 hypothetical protein K489DRAFT_385256 [Dissoconium aciculare CBS 342.82]